MSSNKPFPIPIRSAEQVAAAEHTSTPAADLEMHCLEMPETAMAFQMPDMPSEADPESVEAAADILEKFTNELAGWTFEADADKVPRADFSKLPLPVLKVMNDVLGEGEVGARVKFREPSPNWRNIYAQESIFTGVWRVREFAQNGDEIAHWIEASALPKVLIDVALGSGLPRVPDAAMPEGVMNAPAMLTEIASQLEGGVPDEPYEINLTLLPLSPADYDALLAAFPVGTVAIRSHSFGDCRVTSTGVQNVWRVQHFNHKSALILNEIVVTRCPQEIAAAKEDLEDSAERLKDLVGWMRETVAKN